MDSAVCRGSRFVFSLVCKRLSYSTRRPELELELELELESAFATPYRVPIDSKH